MSEWLICDYYFGPDEEECYERCAIPVRAIEYLGLDSSNIVQYAAIGDKFYHPAYPGDAATLVMDDAWTAKEVCAAINQVAEKIQEGTDAVVAQLHEVEVELTKIACEMPTSPPKRARTRK